MKRIYLDYAASTPVDKKVLAEMLPYFSRTFGNASSLHFFGREAGEAVEKARKILADYFGADDQEIIFTSGATESNNLAVKGVLRAYYADKNNKEKPHIITTAFEHHCVLEACHLVEKEGLAEVTYLPVHADGTVQPEDVRMAMKQNTVLVSIMYVNNEIGTVQPIEEIGELIRKMRNNNQEKGNMAYPLFHTDATQAVNYFNCDVNELGVDLLSMSGHKIYGPKGVGALYVRKNIPIFRIQDGGAQEMGKRSGTLNTPGIVGLGSAIGILKKDKQKNFKKITLLRNHLIGRVLKEIPDVLLNGSAEKRSPNNANFSFKNVEGESLLLMLDMEGIACSTGSACSSGSLTPSHVLLSIGLKPEQAHGSLRVSLGKYTTKKELDVFVSKLKKIVGKIRKISGDVLKDYYKNNN